MIATFTNNSDSSIKVHILEIFTTSDEVTLITVPAGESADVAGVHGYGPQIFRHFSNYVAAHGFTGLSMSLADEPVPEEQ